MAAGSVLSGCQGAKRLIAARPHVVVIGGGFGGATAAKYLRLLDANIQVTLIEPKASYTTCPGSNWLFADLINIGSLSVDYRRLKDQYDINILTGYVDDIDRSRRRVRLADGSQLNYDRLIMAPGIDFRWDGISGYDENIAQQFPHAWQAGPQTLLLRQQLQSMPDGGVLVMLVPADPYRCPPGPYERASMMAYWLKQHKPRSKILILDAKRSFSKQALFEAGWAKLYAYGTANSLIEWHCLADNPVVRLDASSKTLITEFGDRFSGDVLNIIPAQRAAFIAEQTGLSDASGWCPVHPQLSQSRLDEFIHIIGDAANYAPIPKSAFAANSEAKACALAVVGLLNGYSSSSAHWVNTCYSLLGPDYGISVAGVYKPAAAGLIEVVPGAGGVSTKVTPESVAQEADYARLVYQNLVNDSFY